MADCPDLAVLRDSKLDEILTQYRESEKLLGLINNYLIQLQEMGEAVSPSLLSSTLTLPLAIS